LSIPAHSASHTPPAASTAIDAAALSAVLAGLPQAVFVVDMDAPHAVQWRNEAGAQMETSAGKAGVIADGSVLAQGLATVKRTGQLVTLHDHSLLGVSCYTISLTPLPQIPNTCIVMAVPASHVTADSHNGARETLRSAGLMARMLAHEIKNPLAGIQAAGQLLAKKAQDAVDRDLTDLVVRETARISRLIDRMTIFDGEGGTATAFVPINVHAPIEHALSATAAAFPDVAIIRHFDPSLPDIAGDHDHLVQIFDNLCRNAAEAGATIITLRSFYNHTSAPVDSRHQRRLPVTVTIEDNGTGMDAQTLTRLFEPYYTTKSQGQGLGLPIVAKLIDDHAGLITVSSEAGKTIFTIAFPHDRDLALKGEQL